MQCGKCRWLLHLVLKFLFTNDSLVSRSLLITLSFIFWCVLPLWSAAGLCSSVCGALQMSDVACSEYYSRFLLQIRAAAIMHCPFITALSEGDASFFNFKQRHQVHCCWHILHVRLSEMQYNTMLLCVCRVFFRDSKPSSVSVLSHTLVRPPSIRDVSPSNSFRKILKTRYFSLAFNVCWCLYDFLLKVLYY